MFNPAQRYAVTAHGVRGIKNQVRSAAVVARSQNSEEAMFGGAASLGAGIGVGHGGAAMNMTVSGPMANISMLAGMVSQDENQLRKYYRDMYFYDAICGSAVDMISTFAYSDFSLTGLEPERIEKYTESMVRLNIRTLMPLVTRTTLVDGSYVGSLLFNQRDKVFIDTINYPVDDCVVEELPMMSSDPIITVRTSEVMRRFIRSQNAQARTLRRMLPASLLNVLGSGAFELDEMSTLYVSRKTLPGVEPTSWLKRVLPAYLLEKTLFRGTIIEAMRRQRAMLHVAMGDDVHEYTPEEMAETVNQFQMADLDPLGAIVGTRNTVQIQEVRQGGDFWKWPDIIETMVPHKLRALGISEAFLSGDSNYSNVETGMSVFMENLDGLRSDMTYEVLTNKVFPMVAVANQFFKPGKEVDTRSRTSMQYQLTNHNDLDIPQVRWHKQLEARSEDNVMETLSGLQDKGFPIPLRMWAAAAKIDINHLYEDLRQDKEIKKKLEQLTGKAVQMTNGQDQDGDGGGFGSDFGQDGGDDNSQFAAPLQQLTRPFPKMPMLLRQFTAEQADIKDKTKTGKDKAIYNQRRAHTEMNRLIARSIKELNDPHVRASNLKRVRARLGSIPQLFRN